MSLLGERSSCHDYREQRRLFFPLQTHSPRQLGSGRVGNQARELLCSSWSVSTKAMIHGFPVENETLKQFLDGGEARSLASAPGRK